MSKSDAIRDLVRQGLEAEELHEEISQLQEQIEHLQQLEVRIEDLEAERQQTSGLVGRLF